MKDSNISLVGIIAAVVVLYLIFRQGNPAAGSAPAVSAVTGPTAGNTGASSPVGTTPVYSNPTFPFNLASAPTTCTQAPGQNFGTCTATLPGSGVPGSPVVPTGTPGQIIAVEVGTPGNNSRWAIGPAQRIMPLTTVSGVAGG